MRLFDGESKSGRSVKIAGQSLRALGRASNFGRRAAGTDWFGPRLLGMERRRSMSEATKKVVPDRAKITVEDNEQVKYWTRHLGISREQLERIVERVGNSAASVRKELAGAEGEHPAR